MKWLSLFGILVPPTLLVIACLSGTTLPAPGTEWQVPATAITKIVAASDSQNKEKADYVADGTSDQVEINEALNALPADGGLVVLLEGTFNTAAPITVAPNRTLMGQGWNSIINAGGEGITNAIVVGGDNVTIRNLKVQLVSGAGTAGNRPNIIYSNARADGLFEHLWLVGDSGVDDGSDLRQSGIIFINTTYSKVGNVTIFGGKRPAINLQTSHNNKVVTNKIFFTSAVSNETGVWLYGSDSNLIDGNHINNAKDSIYTVNSDNNVITNNRILTNVSEADGIMLVDGSDNNTINGNSVYGGSGVVISGTASINNNITGNEITNASKRGIYLDGHADGSVVLGNTITGNTASYGVDSAGADRVIIEGNVVRNSASGLAAIHLLNTGYSKIRNNSVFNNRGDGIYIFNDVGEEPENVIMGNEIIGNTGRGLVITGTGAVGYIVSDNYFSRNSGGDISDGGIDTRVGRNITGSLASEKE